MARLRSRIPRSLVERVDEERYLEGLDRRIPARDDVSSSATLAEVITAINDLYDDLRENGLMES